MRFHVEQRFTAPLDVVEAALLDPLFLNRLADLPELGRPELVDHHVDGDLVRQRVRYRFAGSLPPAVTAVIDPERLTWIDECTFDRSRHRGEHRIVPDHYGNRLRASYATQLEPSGPGAGTVRRIDGEVRVKFPLVAGKVERAIVSGLTDHARLEAGLVAQWLEERG